MKAPVGEEQRLFTGSTCSQGVGHLLACGQTLGDRQGSGSAAGWNRLPGPLMGAAGWGGEQPLWFRGQHVWIFLGSGDKY